MDGRLNRFGLACVLALVLASFSAAAFAIPPSVEYSLSAPGNTATGGWYNVPITLTFADISWDDPLVGGHYGIAAISVSRGGGPPMAVIPTSTLSLSDDGTYTVTCLGSWGGSAYPIELGIDRTPPQSWLSVTSLAGVPRVSLTASDSCSGPHYLAYSLDSAAGATIAVSQARRGAFVVAKPGAHNIRWMATDVAGNAERSWHAQSFTVPAPVVWKLSRPSARQRRGLMWFSGRIAPRLSTRVNVVIERWTHGRWRRAASASIAVRAGTGSWAIRRLKLPRGLFRLRAIAVSGARSPTAHFRR